MRVIPKSILQDEKVCYITGRSDCVLHKHHIFGGNANRPISEREGFFVYLIPHFHNMSDEGVHFNKPLDLMLKQACQRKYEETHTRDEFVAMIGKNYL